MIPLRHPLSSFFFFFNDTATTEIYTLSLHDALPIWLCRPTGRKSERADPSRRTLAGCWTRAIEIRILLGVPKSTVVQDRKSTRLNSSHSQISYAVFCLKKKNKSASSLTILTSL